MYIHVVIMGRLPKNKPSSNKVGLRMQKFRVWGLQGTKFRSWRFVLGPGLRIGVKGRGTTVEEF